MGMGCRAPAFGLLVAAAAAALTGCGGANVARERVTAAPTTSPTAVYIADFELDASTIREQRGLLPPPPPPLPGLPRLPGAPVEPAVRARQLVDLMANSLVSDLARKGVSARRLRQGERPPVAGWLVRGVFTEVQAGNQFRRAVIGFGAGQTELQVIVAVDDLVRGAPQSMYEMDTRADSGRLPGAAITLNPVITAARFALAGGDLDRNVEQTAAQISEAVARRVKAAGAAPGS
jgi:hypothetical protein